LLRSWRSSRVFHPSRTPQQIADEISLAPGGTVLVLEGPEGDGPCAYCAYRVVLDEMQVVNVAVAPEQRRRGLAGWLLRFSIRRAARAGARRAVLEVRAGNRDAVALYESLGFARLGRRREYYREPPEDALVLGLEGLGTES
jgi:ribosomal-protein-alanine N-acetyltransferase